MSSQYSPNPAPPTWSPPPSNSSGGALVVIAVIVGLLVMLFFFCVAGLVAFRLFAGKAMSAPNLNQPVPLPAPVMVPPGPIVPQPPLVAPMNVTPADPRRNEWTYAVSPEGTSGAIKHGPAGWTETRSDGTSFQFQETARSDDFIELYDAARRLHVRLYGDHIEWTREPPNWTRGQSGEWKSSQ